MFDRYNSCHTISNISTCKVNILFLKDVQFSCIVVDDICKHGFKAGNMCTAFSIVNIITKTKNIFMELINILECNLNRYAFALT